MPVLESKPIETRNRQTVYLFLLSGGLLVGIVAGVLAASYLNLAAEHSLFSGIQSFLTAEGTPSFWETAWKVFRVPLLLLALGLTCFGVAAIPFVSAAQGFLFSFSVSAMVRLFGGQGFLLGLATFGLQALTVIPCILVWGAQSMAVSKVFFHMLLPRQHPGGGSVFPRGFFLALCLGFALLLIGTALEFWLVPRLVSWAAAGIIT